MCVHTSFLVEDGRRTRAEHAACQTHLFRTVSKGLENVHAELRVPRHCNLARSVGEGGMHALFYAQRPGQAVELGADAVELGANAVEVGVNDVKLVVNLQVQRMQLLDNACTCMGEEVQLRESGEVWWVCEHLCPRAGLLGEGRH